MFSDGESQHSQSHSSPIVKHGRTFRGTSGACLARGWGPTFRDVVAVLDDEGGDDAADRLEDDGREGPSPEVAKDPGRSVWDDDVVLRESLPEAEVREGRGEESWG